MYDIEKKHFITIEDTLEIENALNDDGELDASSLKIKESILSFSDVSFAYPNAGNDFIDNVTFDIKRGETVGIIGGTGSGKSTMIDIIIQLFTADKKNEDKNHISFFNSLEWRSFCKRCLYKSIWWFCSSSVED